MSDKPTLADWTVEVVPYDDEWVHALAWRDGAYIGVCGAYGAFGIARLVTCPKCCALQQHSSMDVGSDIPGGGAA